MSRVEDRALKEYPQNIVTDYNGSHDLNYYKRVLYQQGYHQAEKDLELSLEDIKTIDKLLNQCVDYSNPYQEVLKRFNKERKEK